MMACSLRDATERALRVAWLVKLEPEVAAAIVTGVSVLGVKNAYGAFKAEADRYRELAAA